MIDQTISVNSGFVTAKTVSAVVSMNDQTGQRVAIKVLGDDQKNYHFDSDIPTPISNKLVRDFLCELSKIWPSVAFKFKANQLTISEIQLTPPVPSTLVTQPASAAVPAPSISASVPILTPPVVPPPDKP